MGLVSELRRRNVFRVAIAYVLIAWIILEAGDVLAPALHLPEWVVSALVFFLVLGFPLALIFAWAFELTPEGVRLEKHVDRSHSITHITGRKLDYIIIGVLAVALVLFSFDEWVLEPARDNQSVQATTEAATNHAAISVDERPASNTVAVLAFADLSPEGDQEYFSDGVSEEILNVLAQIPDLHVTSRSSAFSFKGKGVDIPTVAEQLGVANILEGSVRKSGNHIRITAQLIDAKADKHLWSETYDRELDDIFAVQDEIAIAVVDALKITLLGNEPRATETNPEAYALYLRGRYFINQGTNESHEQAETLLKQTLAIDAGFAPAWAELSGVYFEEASYFSRSPGEGMELARNAAQKALSIDPKYAPAYINLAAVERQFDWNFISASEHSSQALSLGQGNADVLTGAADLYTRLGRFDEAIELYRKAITLDPISSYPHFGLGRVLYYANRLDEAAAALRMAVLLTPEKVKVRYLLGRVLLAQGDAHGALAAMQQESGAGYRLIGMTVVQHALGNTGASDAALRQLIEKWAKLSSYQIALANAYRGEIDNSFDWLQRAYDLGDGGLTKMMVDPLLANLHNDPRWEPFLDKMGFPR